MTGTIVLGSKSFVVVNEINPLKIMIDFGKSSTQTGTWQGLWVSKQDVTRGKRRLRVPFATLTFTTIYFVRISLALNKPPTPYVPVPIPTGLSF